MSTLSNIQLQALVDNLTNHAPKATFVVNGVTYTSSKIAALAASVLTARSGTKSAKAAWKDTRQKGAGIEDEAIPIVGAARTSLVTMFGHEQSIQADLAVAPRKAPTPLTAEARMVVIAKNQATRLARGTASKKEKAKLKGNVTGVVVTPVTLPGPTATTPAAVPVSVAASSGITSTTPAATPAAVAAVPPSASPTVTPTAPAIVAAAVGTPTGH